MSKVKKEHPLLRYCEGETRRPFSNGTEFEIWDGNNCSECASCNPVRFDDSSKSERLAKKGKHCHLECHLAYAYMDKGLVSASILEEIGYRDGDMWMPSKCAKFKPKDDRKGPPKPKRPRPVAPNQLVMFVLDDILIKTPAKKEAVKA
jgi:hypothetical protein